MRKEGAGDGERGGGGAKAATRPTVRERESHDCGETTHARRERRGGERLRKEGAGDGGEDGGGAKATTRPTMRERATTVAR